MALSATIVPPVTSFMTAEYLTEFMSVTIPSGGNLIQILETGPRLVLIYDDGN